MQVKLGARKRAPAECSTITREIAVRADKPPAPRATSGSVWPLRNTWSRATENLYSAWIEKLFDAPLDATLSWKALHEVLRDRSRNVLFKPPRLGEDQMGMVRSTGLRDLPYFCARISRSKWDCRSGTQVHAVVGGPPRCPAWWKHPE